jgi:hypothetical protein
MQDFLQKINKNRKIIFSVFLLLIFPSLALGVVSEIFDDILIAIGSLLVYLSSILLFLSGLVFDNLLMITLSTELFNSPFVKVAWSNIRDIANIGFILGAIYIAFSMMIGDSKWQTSLVRLLIVIFLINFSLFFTRVIVDAGNITARVFLSSMSTKIVESEDYFAVAKSFYASTDSNNFVSVSASFQKVLKIEDLLGIESFRDYQKFKNKLATNDDGEIFLIIALVVAVVSVALSKHLFIGGFMFLSRMIWIIVYMIASPVAFISAFIPGYENEWRTKWLNPLIQKSFCIVVYLFFIWISIIILKSGFVNSGQGIAAAGINSENLEPLLVTISIFIIKAIFIIRMLSMGTDLGKKWCENGEGMMSGFGEKVWGMGKGLVQNIAAAPARQLTGAASVGIGKLSAKGMASNSWTTRFVAERGTLFGKSLGNMKVGSKSYDTDQTDRIKKLREVENDMSPGDLEKRRRAQLRVDDENGNLDMSRVDTERFTTARMQKKWDDLMSGKDSKTNREIEKKVEESESEVPLTLNDDGRAAWLLNKRNEIKDAVEKENKDAFNKSLKTKDVNFNRDGDGAVNPNTGLSLLARIIPAVDANRNRFEKDESAKSTLADDAKKKNIERLEWLKFSKQADADKTELDNRGNNAVSSIEKFATNVNDFDHVKKALAVVITNPGERDKISDRLESGARKIDADRKFVENNQGKDVEESKKELLKTKNKLSDIENKIKNAELDLSGIKGSDAVDKSRAEGFIKDIKELEIERNLETKEISKAEDNLEKVENKYNNKMEKVNSDSKDFLDSAKKTINDIIHTQKESIEANLDYQKVLIKESVGQSTLTSGDASREEKAGNSVITKTSAEQVDAGGT